MTEAFVAFVRFEEKLLLLKRNSSTEHFPDLWDGVWGVADTPRKSSIVWLNPPAFPSTICTTTAPAQRGIDMGRNLVDVMPILVVSKSDEVTPRHLHPSRVGRPRDHQGLQLHLLRP